MPVTDQQIIDYLALGDTTIVEADPETDEGQHYETAEQPGQGVYETAKYLGVTEARVRAVQRANRQEIDRKFEQRDGMDWQ